MKDVLPSTGFQTLLFALVSKPDDEIKTAFQAMSIVHLDAVFLLPNPDTLSYLEDLHIRY